MPEVPRYQVPQVGRSAQPLPTNVDPAAFGANVVGAGLKELGEGVGDVSEMLNKHALQMAALDNQAAADTALTAYSKAANQLQSDFFDLKGEHARNGLPQAFNDLESLRAKTGSTLGTPAAKQMFDMASRESNRYFISQFSAHAATEWRTHVVNSHKAALETSLNLATQAYGKPGFEAMMFGAFSQTHQLNELAGGDKETLGAAWNDARSQVYLGAVDNALSTNRALEAEKILNEHADEMTFKDRVQAERAVRAGVRPVYASIDAQAAIDHMTGGGEAAEAPAGYIAAVHLREGTGKNPRSSATGTGQFINATWLRLMKSHPEFANYIRGKSDREILALRNDPKIGDMAIVAYGQDNATYLQYQGLPVTPATVGLAHGYGPAGAKTLLTADPNASAASVLSPEIIKANPDLRNKTVGQVITGFERRFGTGPLNSAAAVEASAPSIVQAAREAAARRYPEDPTYADLVEQTATAKLNRTKSRFDAQDYAAQGVLIEALNGGADGQGPPPTTVEELLQYPGARAAWTEVQSDPRRVTAVLDALDKNANPTPRSATPEMQRRYRELIGMANDPYDTTEFQNLNIELENLPNSWKTSVYKMQLAARAGKGLESPWITAAIKQAQPYLTQHNIHPSPDDPESAAAYNEFRGSLVDSLHAFYTIYGRNAHQQEIEKIIQNEFTKGVLSGNEFYAFQRPNEQERTIVQNVPNPVAMQIAAALRRQEKPVGADIIRRIYLEGVRRGRY